MHTSLILWKVEERIGTYLLVYVQKTLAKDKQETDNTYCLQGGGGWLGTGTGGRLFPANYFMLFKF